ncbi:hypothetical protein [Heliomicrobium modesticaldum]|uniref:hypothetical protein n=1 Tax=Heliomicrobium modesticaldum TaxID=35701 RepID=UPI00059C99C0|nr:hypothetical protein [Heliomicrobium modesticaldum]
MELKKGFLGYTSVGVATLLGLLILNFFIQPVSLSLTSFLRWAVFFPMILGPIGFVVGYLGYRNSKDKYAKWGMISNAALFLFSHFYWAVGTLLFGP